jgi:predicted nucleic acid-binding protein
VTRLNAFLSRHTRIALDTSVFIYSLEENPTYADLADRVLAWVEQPGHLAVTSTVTMTELLVKPIRALEEGEIARMYDLLLDYPHLTWIPIDLEIAKAAALFGAVYNLKTPDALQAATASRSGEQRSLQTTGASGESLLPTRRLKR